MSNNKKSNNNSNESSITRDRHLLQDSVIPKSVATVNKSKSVPIIDNTKKEVKKW